MSAPLTASEPRITTAELQARLERGEPLQVIDIRDADEHAEWTVPGAIHADAYEAVLAGEPGAFDALALDEERPVVVVCWRGQTSLEAARLLSARGLEAFSLEGGMRAWSVAWNTAEIELEGSQARVTQVRRTGKGCLSYLITRDGEATVVDPSLDSAVYTGLAEARGARITRVVETHVHADHLSRARALAEATGASLVQPESDRVAFAHEGVGDGDTLPVGASSLVALATPGHTPGSTSYLLDGVALFTGDTLFLDAVGRPDLEATPEGARTRAAVLYRSLARVAALDGDAWVLPGHTDRPVPFDGMPLRARLAEVRGAIPALGLDEAAFVERIVARLPPTPPNHHAIVEANEAGAPLPADPTGLEAGANRCAVP